MATFGMGNSPAISLWNNLYMARFAHSLLKIVSRHLQVLEYAALPFLRQFLQAITLFKSCLPVMVLMDLSLQNNDV